MPFAGWLPKPCRALAPLLRSFVVPIRIQCIQQEKGPAMSTMTMRVDDVDAAVVRKYAKFEGKTISDFIRDAVFEKIEDTEDLAALRAAVAEDDGTRYSHDQVLAELGL